MLSASRVTLLILGMQSTAACSSRGQGLAPSDEQPSDGETTLGAVTESTGSEDERDDDGSSGSDDRTFVPDDDFVHECDALLQDCPEGEKCVPYSRVGGPWDARKCVLVLGEQAPGEPCTYHGVVAGTDTCDQTGWCWDVMDVDGEPIGTCHQFCNSMSNDPVCPAGQFCADLYSLELALCLPQCNPITQDCGAGLGCYWVDDIFNCVFTTQDIPAGEPCGFINDCAAGSACLAARLFPGCADESCCAAFCDINQGDGQCEAVPGTSCVPFFAEGTAPGPFEHVGVCVSA